MDEKCCPACMRLNPASATSCQYCAHPLPAASGPVPVESPTLTDAEGESAPVPPKDAAIADLAQAQPEALPEKPQYPLLPETDSSSATAEDGLVKKYLMNPVFRNSGEAVGAYAEDFLWSRHGGEPVMLAESAKKQIIATAIFAVAALITASLMMLYHRSYFLFFCIFAALCIAFWFLRVDNRKVLAKKLASMPQAEMESVMMTEIDSLVNKKKVRDIRIVILVAAAVVFVVLFWSPHMIFEPNGNACSLRYYSASFRPEPNVVIPDSWNGRTVISIRGNVFEGLGSIESVVLPSHLLEIRAHAFQGCGRLSSVVFPDTIRSIGSSAFRDCYNLREVTLPQECSVNSRAFKNSGTTIHRK